MRDLLAAALLAALASHATAQLTLETQARRLEVAYSLSLPGYSNSDSQMLDNYAASPWFESVAIGDLVVPSINAWSFQDSDISKTQIRGKGSVGGYASMSPSFISSMSAVNTFKSVFRLASPTAITFSAALSDFVFNIQDSGTIGEVKLESIDTATIIARIACTVDNSSFSIDDPISYAAVLPAGDYRISASIHYGAQGDGDGYQAGGQYDFSFIPAPGAGIPILLLLAQPRRRP